MQTLNIQQHVKDTTYTDPHFFVLANGYGAGRPSATPYTNGFVIIANDEVERGMLFWICFGLWKSNRFIPLLNNSVTSAIDINAAAYLINTACQKMARHPELFRSHVKELKQLIKTENMLTMQVKMIKRIKKSIATRMFGL